MKCLPWMTVGGMPPLWEMTAYVLLVSYTSSYVPITPWWFWKQIVNNTLALMLHPLVTPKQYKASLFKYYRVYKDGVKSLRANFEDRGTLISVHNSLGDLVLSLPFISRIFTHWWIQIPNRLSIAKHYSTWEAIRAIVRPTHDIFKAVALWD